MIYGKRIRLRRPERDDLPLFVDWLNDPEVRAGISMYLPMSMGEEEQWYERNLARPLEERQLTVDMRDGDGWRTIGSTSFFDFDWRNRSAEFGIMIGDKTAWNQGYGTEATELMLDHAFGTLNLHRVLLRVYDFNRRAIRAYEKAGFVLEGTLREDSYVNGEYIDTHLMGVLRQEWAARKARDAGTS